jgi:hypothetical protein
MILAAHQPHFLPWLGYFDRILKSEKFVLLDHVQFERQNFQNRTRINSPQGPRWLTVPVQQRSRSETILEKLLSRELDNGLSWQEKAARTLEHAYGRTPYFGTHSGPLLDLIRRPRERLVDLNIDLLKYCMEALGIRTPVQRSSELGLTGAKSELVLSMCRAVGADVYLSGTGGSRGYLDVAAFEREGVKVVWQEFRHPGYPQRSAAPGKPVQGLSVVDLLFHCGPASGDVLRGGAAVIS